MSDVAVMGAGAFGTAMAVVLAQEGNPVVLWTRSAEAAERIGRMRVNEHRLAGVSLPSGVHVSADLADVAACGTVLVAVPMQRMSELMASAAASLDGRALVACAKGVDLATGQGPTAVMAGACPASGTAVLTGPSFAADIAAGLPTALTLASSDTALCARLQRQLSRPSLRLYRSSDVVGAEFGGALKNVIAIAAGIVIGAGLGDSARAALMTRGYAEMTRLALARGARPETLAGLSGFGDLVLTCTSERSRNFRQGRALGVGESFDTGTTVEGAATARAVSVMGRHFGIEMPITDMVTRILDGSVTVPQAAETLLSRPLKEESE